MPHSDTTHSLKGSRSQFRPARWIAAAIRQRPLTSRVRHIHQLTAVIFCSLAPSLFHHSANAGLCSRTAEARCIVAAWGCTGCHSVHGEARITQKGHYVDHSMCAREHLVACARRHPSCLAFTCTRMRGDTIVWPELTQIGVKKRAQNQLRFAMNVSWASEVPPAAVSSSSGGRGGSASA
jgi:hypothetical protein